MLYTEYKKVGYKVKLIFDEHFNNLNNWNFEKGFVRNQELQYYTDRNIELTNKGKERVSKKWILW